MLDRRKFIKEGARWGGYALAVLIFGFPILSFIGFRKVSEKRISFPPDSQHAAANFKDGVYLMSSNDGFYALSAKCPHLGCTVNFDAVSGRFKCPCHGSVFAASGKWISGPAQRNLQPLPIQKKPDGHIETVLKI
jgi:cytochrome b6-f complex iron-sulfur subunit